MKKETIKIITSMGYRELGISNKFMKPIGWSAYVITKEDNDIVFRNRFKNNDDILIYNSARVIEENFTIDFIKDCEIDTTLVGYGDTNFEFLSCNDLNIIML